MPARWAVLVGGSAALFIALRAVFFFLPQEKNYRLLIGFAVYLAVFLYSIVYGLLAYRLTHKVLLPALLLTVLAFALFFTETSGVLDTVQRAVRPANPLAAIPLYLGKALPFGVIAAIIGGVIKNLSGD